MAGNTRNSRKGVSTITHSAIALIELMKPIEYFLPNDEVIHHNPPQKFDIWSMLTSNT
jgi:hypothetical protein